MLTDGIKKAKIFGVIAVIFFIIIIVLILIVTALTGTSIREDDIIGTMLVYIMEALFFISIPLTIIFTILAVYTYFKYKKQTAPIKNAMKLIYERYAKGEISKEELEKMKKDLES